MISQLIMPAIPPESLQSFLWKHAIHDMHLLSKATGRSVDDTALLVHLVLQNASMFTQTNQGRYHVLQTKEQRKQWETFFSKKLIQPVISNLEDRLQNTMKLIVNDRRFGANPLLCQLYELESNIEDYTKGIQSNCVALWRFRTPVTLGHVVRTFSESDEALKIECVVLEEFFKKEKQLRSVRFLPDVVKLQKLLMDHFHRTLDRTEPNKLKLKSFYKRLPKGDAEELMSLIQSFRSALDMKALTEKGTLSNPSLDDNSLVSMFIPTNTGPGKSSLDLVRFLVQTHNEFLEFYRRQSEDFNLPRVSLLDVTNSELVSYDTDRDLLPLILAHCRYSLQPGHGTLVEYKWFALQKQIVDRLIRGRMLIDFQEKKYTQTCQVTAESLLAVLKTKIPQVELSLAIQNQIIHQYRSLEDICDALSTLNTAITFLASGGGKFNMLISEYLQHVLMLHEDSGLHNTKAQEVCQLQHAVSLWRLLSVQRAKILTRRGQDPFEHLPSEFKDLPKDGSMVSALKNSLKKLNKGCLDTLISFLLDLIVLHLKDDMDIYNLSLKDYITWYTDEKDLERVAGVDCIPDGVLLKHVVLLWEIALEITS